MSFDSRRESAYGPSLDIVRECLGSPAYESEGIVIYCGDSLPLLSQLPVGLVDLTVTSPPYNIGKAYETKKPLDDYVAWCVQWINEIHRITAPSGAFWLNLGYVYMPGKAKAIPIPYLLWDKVPFYLIQEVVWNYGAGVASRKSFSPRNEKFLWYVKDADSYKFDLDAVRDPDVKYPNQRKNGRLKCNPLGKNPSDVWRFAKVTSGANRSSAERTSHPAQFPVAVVERIIKACSAPGDLILDPFLGSGTVTEVALRLGRSVVGIELHEPYVGVAISRVEQALANRRVETERQSLFSVEQS